MSEKFNIDSLADLARIRLKKEEKAKLTNDLSKILGYVEALGQLNLEGIEPTTHVAKLENVFRADEVKPALVREEVLKHSPHREGNFFKVPKVIDQA
ncbi:MAG: Asp-tRNA(Asn)/Glu-tRNA(Gln) amidotransferase GatCAB subunit C [Candidatus Omnitrophica bacterium CG11_big_fil_rev_8_21_14_0_20_45_26]|uniref:Aspartyl/glutamyl-tRNA(Asn/Gln) amidotransferase subunit C n=1 Tax=Candidatus Abzuiibacterium crystallinum TaxID=1974748 RepID=A0A2H0LNA3_9BACT|nr:MAG: Asp-tRNA(Asn)/Glu-tRNA(Gln) amidotransferase GatCAB subunit C [Candidatus Omnitrophica bacterium CG11_big_fil_rev_8_21_14_0_20_45_26]PIW65077.1 MAG: Asp-tRNA(Asn)/Glu-tRNA(Gln) amidotransferase GatCAB subunit C [Candidatus Omnitrophica bacterium CG12_big_fil_rev_8_21_14_0_65_45_16]